MKRSALSLFIILFLVLAGAQLGFRVAVEAAANTIYVPDDYPTIQQAINAALDGDSIFVHNGTYSENIVVNKTVTLIGENEENTIITAANSHKCR